MSAEVSPVLRYVRRVLDDPHSQGVADADLLQRFVTHRDETAFELLMWRHAGMVLSVCRAILRDHHLAEDAFQASFLALARKAGSIGRREVVAGWLYRVAHHAALKARCRRARDAAQEIVTEPTSPPERSDFDLTPLLHEELGRLPEKYRTPLVLCFLEGQSHADVARLLGWPKGTVAGRVARAREILRQRLTRRGIVLSAALFGTALTAASASALPPTLMAITARAALAFAAGGAGVGTLVSSPVLRLTEGVLHAMFLSKIKSIGFILCLVGCVVVSGGFLGGWALAQKPGTEKAPGGAGGGPPAKPMEDPAVTKKLKANSLNNLKQIAQAILNFHDANSHFPADILDANKKPLLSWRIHLLPYVEQTPLYQKFKLDEPWDSEHNLKLLAQMPDIFRTGTEAKDSSSTYYQGFADERAMFPLGKKLRMADVPDGTSNTIIVIEAGTAVPWTKPADLPYTSNKPLPKLGGPFKDVIHAAFVDGTAIPIKREFDEKKMRLAIMRDDGEPQSGQDLRADEPPANPKNKPNKDQPIDPNELAKQLIEAATARDQAAREAARAAELLKLAQVQRDQAELFKLELLKAQQEAVRQRDLNESLRLENEKLKSALRDLTAQLNKLASGDKPETKPGANDLKSLTAEMERTQLELRRLREEVEKLKKALDK